MIRFLPIVAFILSVLPLRAGEYSHAMFVAAWTNYSTATDYVLIKVRGPGDKAERTVCTTVNFLRGAIDMEYRLLPTEEKRETEIAMRHRNGSFTFRKQSAIANLIDYGTPEALADVRRIFADKKDSELLNREFINSIASKRHDAMHRAYRDAVARALLERGIGCVMGCESDELFPHL